MPATPRRDPHADGIFTWIAALRVDQILFLLWITLLPIMRPLYTVVGNSYRPATDYLFALAALAWVVALVRRRASLVVSRVYLFFAVYAIALALSTVFSAEPWQSLRKLVGEVYLISIGVLTVNFVRSAPMLRYALTAWLAGATVTAMVGVLSVCLFYAGLHDSARYVGLAGYGSLPPGAYPRIRSLFFNMNMLCSYLTVSLLFTLAMREAGWLARRWFWPLAAGIVITALFTLSPGLGGMALAIGLWVWAGARRTRPRRALIAIAIAITLSVVIFLASTISPVVFMAGGGWGELLSRGWEPSSRVQTWHAAFDVFRRELWFGQGLGLPFPEVRYLNASGHLERLTDAHNVWLSVAGQMGLAGLLAFAALILWLVVGCFPLRLDGRALSAIRIACGIALIAEVFWHGLTISPENFRHLWLLFGLTAAVIGLPPEPVPAYATVPATQTEHAPAKLCV